MKKRNVSIKAAVAIACGFASISSFAGIANGLPNTVAAQSILGAATILVPGKLAYSMASPIAIGNAFVTVTLANGAKFAAAAGGTVATTALVATNLGGATVTTTAGTVSADQLSVVFPIAVSGAPTIVGTVFSFVPVSAATTDGSLNNATALNTAGGSISASIQVGSSLGTPSNIDTPASGTIATGINGVTTTILSSGAANFVSTAGMTGVAVETKQIQVATGSGIALTPGTTSNTGGSTVLINFGGFRFNDVAGSKDAAGGTFSMANNYTPGGAGVSLNVVATGNFSAAQGTGGSVTLSTNNACVGGTLSTGTVTATQASFTIPSATVPTSGTPTYLCMQLNTTNAVVIQPVTPSVVTTLNGLTANTAAAVSAATSLFSLTNNGGAVLVKTYIPAVATGYTSYIRVVNSGSVAAPVNAAVVDQVTGVAGSSAVIVPTLAAGGSITLTSAQIEAAVGVIATATNRPTLRVTAPTAIKVQSFILTNANGNFSEVSGQETAQ